MLTAVLHYDSGVNRHGSDARANSASSISSIHARERLVVGLGAERAEHRPDHRGCGRRGVFRVAEKARRLLRGGVESKQLVATFVRIARRRSVVPDHTKPRCSSILTTRGRYRRQWSPSPSYNFSSAKFQ